MFTEKSDVWSCGVILYLMLCGFLPFIGHKENQTISQIVNKEVGFTDIEWVKVSDSAKDLIRMLLDKDPAKRPDAHEVIMHPWIQKNMHGIGSKVCLDSVKNLVAFKSQIKIQHATFEFIVSHLSTQMELKKLQDTFMILDIDGDGKLSKEELLQGIEKAAITEEYDIEEIIDECDADGNNFIDYTEFLTVAMNWKQCLSRKKLEIAFKTFDINGDDMIDMNELKEMIGGAVNTEMYNEIMKEADTNGDGFISYQEFEKICTNLLN